MKSFFLMLPSIFVSLLFVLLFCLMFKVEQDLIEGRDTITTKCKNYLNITHNNTFVYIDDYGWCCKQENKQGYLLKTCENNWSIT